MKSGLLLLLVLPALILIGCQRDRGVQAGSDDYQPRPAPVATQPASQDIHGELARVNLPNHIFVVRVENGMEQTFKFDDFTVVMGLTTSPATVRNLAGKEGSEMVVQWKDDDGAKVADRVDVTQPVTNVRRRRR